MQEVERQDVKLEDKLDTTCANTTYINTTDQTTIINTTITPDDNNLDAGSNQKFIRVYPLTQGLPPLAPVKVVLLLPPPAILQPLPLQPVHYQPSPPPQPPPDSINKELKNQVETLKQLRNQELI